MNVNEYFKKKLNNKGSESGKRSRFQYGKQ